MPFGSTSESPRQVAQDTCCPCPCVSLFKVQLTSTLPFLPVFYLNQDKYIFAPIRMLQDSQDLIHIMACTGVKSAALVFQAGGLDSFDNFKGPEIKGAQKIQRPLIFLQGYSGGAITGFVALSSLNMHRKYEQKMPALRPVNRYFSSVFEVPQQ